VGILTTLVLAVASLTAQAEAATRAQVRPINPVVRWNQQLLLILRTPGAQPATIHPTRSFAILHAAIYDAVNSIDRTHAPYLLNLPGASRRASQDAAVAGAAHEVLVTLYPAFKATLDRELQQSLAQAENAADRADGVRIGEAVADQILTLRSQDGSGAPPIPYVFGTAPGDYQSTPPNFPPQPQLTQWPFVMPFALRRANQFRPGPPPPLRGERYLAALNEVEAVGMADSETATATQMLIGRFWNGAIQNYWNEIAQTASNARNLTTAEAARLFALLNLSLADSVIAFYDAKYTYNFWRPVTAIRAGADGNNADTAGDANWLPEVTTTGADPSYPGAHAVVSGASAEVLNALLGRRLVFAVTSETMPGAVRRFKSFSAAAREASVSRILAGQHFRFDEDSGSALGREVADFVADHFLAPLHNDGR
jgi:hypothetical protein